MFDEALAEQWEALRALPDGSLGREVVKFYDARGFVFPGRPGARRRSSRSTTGCTCSPTTGRRSSAEIEVFGFISRANDDSRRLLVARDGDQPVRDRVPRAGAGLFEYDPGHLSHRGMAARLADALRRGALCGAHAGGPDLLKRDWFADAARSVADVHAELGIVAKSELALESGSVTAWEPGGISPYQYECGCNGRGQRPGAPTTPTARDPTDRPGDPGRDGGPPWEGPAGREVAWAACPTPLTRSPSGSTSWPS